MNSGTRRLLQWTMFAVVALVVAYAGIRAGVWLRARSAPPVVEAPDLPFVPGGAFPDVFLADSLGAGVGTIELVSSRQGAVVLFLDPNCDGCSEMAARWQHAISEGLVDPARVFGITSESPETNARYRAAHALTYPIYQDVESAFLRAHGVVTYPMEVVVDAAGTIQSVSTDSRTPIDGESIRAMIGAGRIVDPRLEALIAGDPVFVLISSVGVVAGADSLCDDLIEDGWESYYPDNLADRTTPERLATGHEWLRRKIAGLPRDEREAALARLEGRVGAYVEVLSIGGFVESLAMGVALTPSLADLLPDNLNSRGADTPEEAGWTLASGEHAGLRHKLAQRLGDMQPHERAAVLRGLKENVAYAEKQVGAGEREP